MTIPNDSLLSTSRAWRELHADALRHNAYVLQNALSPTCRLMAVVKADAYGHGAAETARILERWGVNAFAVACLQEGIALREAGIKGKILILGYTPPELSEFLSRWSLTQTVADLCHGQALSASGFPLSVHLAIDTGMHRLGIPAADHAALFQVFHLPHLTIEGVFSHLCMADSQAPEARLFTAGQLQAFYDAVTWMRAAGLDPGAIHIQASSAIAHLPPQPCAYARPGLALYGICSEGTSVPLQPALSLRARVGSVRKVAMGEGAGYGLAFRAQRDTRLAVLTIGYGDGLPASLCHQGGQVLLSGQRCPMVGRMCMDQLLVDVTDMPGVQPGDIATIIGEDHGAILRGEEIAEKSDLLPNALFSGLGSRLPVVVN